jgi:hypothetical protein
VFLPSVEKPALKRQLSFYLFTTTPLIYSTDALAVDTPNSIVNSSSCLTIDPSSTISKPPTFSKCAALAKARALPKFLQLPTSSECRQSPPFLSQETCLGYNRFSCIVQIVI